MLADLQPVPHGQVSSIKTLDLQLLLATYDGFLKKFTLIEEMANNLTENYVQFNDLKRMLASNKRDVTALRPTYSRSTTNCTSSRHSATRHCASRRKPKA